MSRCGNIRRATSMLIHAVWAVAPSRWNHTGRSRWRSSLARKFSRITLWSIHTIRNVPVLTQTVFDTPYFLAVYTIRRGFNGPSRFQLFRTYRLRLGKVLHMFSNMNLGVIALLLDEEEQFRCERFSTERRTWVHKCLRNRKMEGELWTLFRELTNDELKLYQ
jgi:hypothetical protein